MARLRPKVHTEKHTVQFSLDTTTSGTLETKTLISAVAAPSTTAEVREGSTVNAVFIEMWIQTDDAALGSSIVSLERLPGGVPIMTAANSAAMNAYNNKKNVLHVQMGLTPNNVTYPMAALKGWFKIPKGKQRFGLGDRLNINLHAQSNGLNTCGFATYKEQY